MKNYLVVENKIVTNYTIAEDDFISPENWIDITDMVKNQDKNSDDLFPTIGWSYVDEVFIPPPLPIDNQ
jgi:hypothetical protein